MKIDKNRLLFGGLLLLLNACETPVIKQDAALVLDPGKHQSPINILTSTTQKEFAQHHFAVQFTDKITEVENLGHTVQLDFAQGSTIKSAGTCCTGRFMS